MAVLDESLGGSGESAEAGAGGVSMRSCGARELATLLTWGRQAQPVLPAPADAGAASINQTADKVLVKKSRPDKLGFQAGQVKAFTAMTCPAFERPEQHVYAVDNRLPRQATSCIQGINMDGVPVT
jgi:hypothetical protein